jgi:NADH pyrophosphatase NudC (nudix superfamily)
MIWKPHATVAAVIENEGKFLLVEELIHGERLYNQPAGHLEDKESFTEATIREVFEESAWKFTPAGVIGVYLWRHPDNGETFLRVALHGECSDHQPEQALDDGIQGTVWKTRDEIARLDKMLRSPLVLECIDDYLNGASYPLSMLRQIRS